MKAVFNRYLLFLFVLLTSCSTEKAKSIQSVSGAVTATKGEIWLTHEHILVDFTGADSIDKSGWDHDSVIKFISPYLDELKKHQVKYFVDATPAYLGRDVLLLEKLAKKTGLIILTNTGFYGATNDSYIPSFAKTKTAEELAAIWINEYQNGIDGTTIKPGFIKISVDPKDTLDAMDEKLVKAAALTHLQTGLTILSHTGYAKALWPQLKIIKEMNVSPDAFVWVHAQMEEDNTNYLLAAKEGCRIAFDGLGWEQDKHVEKILFAKQNKILDRILISNDAGWYDPKKKTQEIRSYSNIFALFYPALRAKGFTDEEFSQLVSDNPARAFSIEKRQ